MDHAIARGSFDVIGFRTKIETVRPKTIAFTSQDGGKPVYQRPTSALALGRQPRTSDFQTCSYCRRHRAPRPGIGRCSRGRELARGSKQDRR